MVATRCWRTLRVLRLLAVLVTLLAGEARLLRAAEWKVRPEHPRLFLAPGDVGRWRERVRTDPALRTLYARVLRFARGRYMHENLWVAPDQLSSVLVCYLLERRDPALRDRALQFVHRFLSAEGDSWTRPRMLKALAHAYDWLWPDLAPAERRRIARRLQELAHQMRARYRHSDYNNHVYLEYGPLLYAGLALAGDGIADEFAEACVALGQELLKRHFIPAVNQVGAEGTGGWPEGMAYWSFFAYEFAHQMEAWRTATGEDLFARCTGLRGAAYWFVHCTRPFDRSLAPIADINTPRRWGHQEAMLFPLLAARYRDSLAAWIARQVVPENPAHAWPWLLWYDPAVQSRGPAQLPTAALFPGIGWVAMRSDWSDDATWAVFVCGDTFCGHQHADQNHFVIYRRGELAVDAGEYGAQETEFHNTVLIGDGQRNYQTDPRRYVAPTPPGSAFDTGEILAYEHRAEFTYVLGDASGAYPREDVTFRRKFLFIRPNVFIVDDFIVADAPVRWLLHLPAEPQQMPAGLRLRGSGGVLDVLRVVPSAGTQEVQRVVAGRKAKSSYRYTYRPESEDGPIRIVHVLYVRDSEEEGAKLPVRAKVDGVVVRLSVQAEGRTWNLELTPDPVVPGWIEARAAGGREELARQPLAAGILPHRPEGIAMVERWDEAYRSDQPPPWDTGRPSSELKRFLQRHRLPGKRAVVLGCGTGTNAIYLAQSGFDVTAIDVAPTALAVAEAKAKEVGVSVRWLLADVLRPPKLEPFDFVFDRGCYHGVRRQSAAAYARTLRALTRPGSRILILAGNATEPPPHYGPPRVHEREIRADFAEGFELVQLRAFRFDTRDADNAGPLAWAILLERTK